MPRATPVTEGRIDWRTCAKTTYRVASEVEQALSGHLKVDARDTSDARRAP